MKTVWMVRDKEVGAFWFFSTEEKAKAFVADCYEDAEMLVTISVEEVDPEKGSW